MVITCVGSIGWERSMARLGRGGAVAGCVGLSSVHARYLCVWWWLRDGVFCLREGCGCVLVVNWPSGLRRQFKALVRKGVGSNPTLANFLLLLSRCCCFWRRNSPRSLCWTGC
jgi:hypothetical protein